MVAGFALLTGRRRIRPRSVARGAGANAPCPRTSATTMKVRGARRDLASNLLITGPGDSAADAREPKDRE